MLNRIVKKLILALVGISAPLQAADNSEYPLYYQEIISGYMATINGDGVPLMDGETVIRRLDDGKRVWVSDTQGDWIRVRPVGSDRRGWIKKIQCNNLQATEEYKAGMRAATKPCGWKKV